MPKGIIGMKEMGQIFEITDSLEIHRERVTVPLEKEGEGAVRRAPDGKIEIVVPATLALSAWLPTLRAELVRLGIEPRDREG